MIPQLSSANQELLSDSGWAARTVWRPSTKAGMGWDGVGGIFHHTTQTGVHFVLVNCLFMQLCI